MKPLPSLPSSSSRSAGLRVVLADDAVFLREVVAELLRSHGCDVVAQVADPAGLHGAIAALRPDVAVVDIRMPPTHHLEGLEAAVAIRRDHPDVGVLLLSQYLESHYLPTLFGAGAGSIGYLLKERVAGTAVFLDAVRRVAAGGCALDPDVAALLVGGRRRRDPLDTLTDREREVLALMAEGRSNRSISDHLVLTPRTVESHVRSIFTRLGLQPQPDDHRRVLAVLTYLQATGTTATQRL
ncbi:DNA-binding response regulator [Protofrankia sp. BMG5.30]|nr:MULTISPECIES: response regulator transcription factor [Protofrankia]ONH34641.1 DNA-binding response regulator [Protofrankia sp. BMG5.30]